MGGDADPLIQAPLWKINTWATPIGRFSLSFSEVFRFFLKVYGTMRSLRALCCSKAETRDDGQDTAVRPSQQRPEKETHSVPTNVKKEPIETNLPPEEPSRRNLWALAFDGLDDSRKKYIPADGLPATDAIQGVIDETTAKYKEWQEKGLTIHRKNGKNINVRDTAEKIMGAAMEAQGAISTLVSFDPTGHGKSLKKSCVVHCNTK